MANPNDPPPGGTKPVPAPRGGGAPAPNPAECDHLRGQASALNTKLAELQSEASKVTGAQKSALTAQINQVQAQVAGIEQE